MSGVLRVPPEQLHQDAAQLKTIAQNMKDVHEQAHSEISELLSGFGDTATAAALKTHLSGWEEESQSHHNHLLDHADFRRKMADEFVAVAERGAEEIRKVRGGA